MNKNRALSLVADATSFIDANLKEEISVGSVCARYPGSPWEFQRMFRAVTLDSIGNYIRTRRLSVAADLLGSRPGSKVIDVALEMQFGSPEAFTRSFKDYFGVSPLDWKKGKRPNKKIKRTQITKPKLERLMKGIKGPAFVEMEQASYVGLTVTIVSPFGQETDFDERIPELWLQFNRRRAEILGREKAIGYGMALEFRDEQGVEKLTYLASARVPGDDGVVPEGMRQVLVPAGRYAAFETTGRVDSSHAIYDYIYGVWLPGTSFKRSSSGYDIETFDRRFQMGSDNSLSTFYFPLES